MNPYLPPADPAARAFPSDGRAGVSEMSVEMLRQTKPWVFFLGVLALIGSGLMALVGLGMLVLGAVASASGGPPTFVLGLVYLPMALLYIYPGIKLWKYGSAIGRLVSTRDGGDLDAALSEQKSFWKYMGIMMLVLIVFETLMIVVAMVAGVLATAARH